MTSVSGTALLAAWKFPLPYTSTAWWKLNLEMTLESDSKYYGSDLIADLTTLPGWRDADDGTRARIVAAVAK